MQANQQRGEEATINPFESIDTVSDDEERRQLISSSINASNNVDPESNHSEVNNDLVSPPHDATQMSLLSLLPSVLSNLREVTENNSMEDNQRGRNNSESADERVQEIREILSDTLQELEETLDNI